MIINTSTLTNGVLVIPDDDVNIPGPALKFSGTTDAAAVAGKLVDTTRPIQVNPSIDGFTQTLRSAPGQNQVAFGGQGVQVGDIVYNTSTNAIAVVGAIDSSSILSLVLPDGSGDDSTAFDAAGTQAYAIYQANGSPFNNGFSYGFRALVGAGLLRSTNASAGYTNAANQAIVASGGTIFDIMNQTGGTPLTFTMTTVGGEASSLLVATAGKFSASSLVGRTVIFDQAAMRNVTAFGNTGTLGATFTFEAADENFTDQILPAGQPKAFQIYNGGAASSFNVLTAGGSTVLIPNVQPGAVIPLAVVRVWAAGTTATLGTTIAFT